MEMKRLNAAGLKAAGYDERNRKLVVETSVGTFEYSNISPEIYRRLMSSPTTNRTCKAPSMIQASSKECLDSCR